MSRLLAVVAALAFCASASAQSARPFLWRLADADSRVYLLGSVHALPYGTDVLPGPVADAYTDAEALAFEFGVEDLADLPMETLERGMEPAGVASDGIPLSRRLSPADVSLISSRIGSSEAIIDMNQPWYLGLIVGAFSPLIYTSYEPGVDVQMYLQAEDNGKPRVRLERVTDLAEGLERLPLADQVLFLRSVLDDLGGHRTGLVAAWESGDAEALAAVFDDGASASSDLHRVRTDRNARWASRVETFLERTSASGQPEDVLVVVGGRHLVGPDGVVEMLRARGLAVERVGD